MLAHYRSDTVNKFSDLESQLLMNFKLFFPQVSQEVEEIDWNNNQQQYKNCN